MKVNRIILISIFMLAILTLTPLCASDEIDNLSIQDENAVSDPDYAEGPGEEIDEDYEDEDYDEDLDDAEYEDEDDDYPPINLKATYPKEMYVNTPTKITFTGSDYYWGEIKVTVDGKTYTGEYDNGKATVKIKALKAGTKTITYRTYFDDGEDETGSFKITAVKTPTLQAKDLSLFSIESKTYKVRLLDNNGKALAGKSLTFYADYKKLKTVKTNDKGYASLKIGKLQNGKYDLKIKYGEITYTKKLTVKSVFKNFKTASVKNAKKMNLQLSTNKVNGKYLKGKTVTIKVAGKSYKAKINSKGIVKLAVKQSAFVKCSTNKDSYYFADAYYGKDSCWVAIQFSKVKPTLSYKLYTRLPWVGGA